MCPSVPGALAIKHLLIHSNPRHLTLLVQPTQAHSVCKEFVWLLREVEGFAFRQMR